jgi:hypothetical protein
LRRAHPGIRRACIGIRRTYPAFAWALALGPTAAAADDVSGSDTLLCYGWTAALCDTDGTCRSMEPWRLNLPDFVKIDIGAKRVSTTDSVADSRATSIRELRRSDGRILLQGDQNDRAFSWLITESTGEGTLTVSTPGEAVSVFTVCTPASASAPVR